MIVTIEEYNLLAKAFCYFLKYNKEVARVLFDEILVKVNIKG